MKDLWLKLVRKILHVQDDPSSRHGREWRWWPLCQWDEVDKRLYLGVELQLIRWQGKECPPRVVGDYTITIFCQRKSWRRETWHMYYDGRHCIWQFGPIAFGRHGLGSCEKCEGDR